MDGKATKIEISGNTLEAVGVIRFSFEEVEYLVYTFNETRDLNGEKKDIIYVSQINSPVLTKIEESIWVEKIRPIVTELGGTIITKLYDYKVLPIDQESYKVEEPRKLATPKNMCIEMLKKAKKVEEENKMIEENQVQTAPKFVDPSAIAVEQPAAPVVETPQQQPVVDQNQNAFNMAPPVADSVQPVAPAPAEPTPVVTQEAVAPVQAASVAETPAAPAPVVPAPTFVETPSQPIDQTVQTPGIVQAAPVEPAPVAPVTPVETVPVAETPVAPVAAPTFVDTPAPVVESAPAPVTMPAEVQVPMKEEPVAPVATTTDINPVAKNAFDTLLNVYNNDKTKIIEDLNNYTPVNIVNAGGLQTESNIDLNSIPVVEQNIQTDSLGEERVFTGNTGPIPVVTPEMVTPVQEVQVAPVEPAPVAPVAPVETTPLVEAAPVAAVPMQEAAPAPQEVAVPTVNEVNVPQIGENDQAPTIAPLGSDEVANIDITTINNDDTLGMKLPESEVVMPEGQTNKVVGFGLMDGQPNNMNNQGMGLTA